MKKRARVCLYIFLVCALILISIGGYFIFGNHTDNVRVGRKFVTFNSVNNASSYSVSVQDESGFSSPQDVVYKVEKRGSDDVYNYAIEVSVDGEHVANETYTQTILKFDSENNKIDCVISHYTIFFLSSGETFIYEDQTLTDVDSNIFCCAVSDYFENLFTNDGTYILTCTSCDDNGNTLEEKTYDYNYMAFYEEDFIRRGEFYYNGVWYDYLIENKDELKNFVWWALLYRMGDGEDLSFYIKTNEINSRNINNLVIESINDYPEYDALEDNFFYAKVEGKLGFLINFDYYLDSDFILTYQDLKNLDTSSGKQYYNYAISNVHHVDNDYSQGYFTLEPSERTFAVDSAQDEVIVYNTEQLFMVLQNGAKPIFVDGRSDVAKTVYENALNVLRNINNSDNLTDLQKVTNIYRYITGEIVYDYAIYAYMEAKNDYSIKSFGNFSSFYLEGVFYDFGLSEHYAVCDGLSKAFSIMCNIEGIDCIKINGAVGDGNHAWNSVYLNEGDLDGWYYVDCTWGEGNYSDSTGNYQVLTHTYFLFDLDPTTREITYPKNYEDKEDISSTDYYKITHYNYIEEEHDFYVESDEELQNAFSYAQYRAEQDSSYVLEVEFDKDYYADVTSQIHTFLALQKEINSLENKIAKERTFGGFGSGYRVTKLQLQLESLKTQRSNWFVDNGIIGACEWFEVDNVIIFRVY